MGERYCSKRIMNGYHSGTCAAKATVENGGKWYCKRHDPVRVAEKEAQRQAKWDAEWAGKQAAWDAEKKAKAHADMCVAFHERLVEILRFYVALGDCSVLAKAEAQILLDEIEKANQQ